MQKKKLNKTFITLLIITLLMILAFLFFGFLIFVSTYDKPNVYSLYPNIIIEGIMPLILSLFLTLIALKSKHKPLKVIFILLTFFLFCYVLFWGIVNVAIFNLD